MTQQTRKYEDLLISKINSKSPLYVVDLQLEETIRSFFRQAYREAYKEAKEDIEGGLYK